MSIPQKYTIFIRNAEGEWMGVKSRPSMEEVWYFVNMEYRAYKTRGRMFIRNQNGKIVWQPATGRN